MASQFSGVGAVSAGDKMDFLLELRSEEIPARMQDKARDDLARLFTAELAKAGLSAASMATYATPRRLALIATALPLETAAVSEETKGPKVGAPPQALEGFLRKTGLTAEQLEDRDGVWFAVVNKPGRATADLLAEVVPAIIRAFAWPKSMRWGGASQTTESLRWVRPLQGIVALLGDAVVPCAVDGIVSGRETMGHRFHSTGPVSIANAGAYAATLRAAHVIVDQDARRAIIRDGAQALCTARGVRWIADEALVVENSGLTEWPVPLLGDFDPAFLDVPPEVIRLTLATNQKYFVCADAEGNLAPAFICTANIDARDGGAEIVRGNLKVLAARLSDARFFWEQDKKIPLATQAEKLARITFHEKLGSVADKVERVAKLARWLVEEGIVGADAPAEAAAVASAVPASPTLRPSPEHRAQLADMAEQAARLCKADLVTEMVGEFPELQGLMGGYYARAEGLPDAVADAIRDHYKPVGQGDDVPTAPVTVAVSLADKLDTIHQFFGAEMQPTGSKDPFALRRAGLGIISLLTTNAVMYPIGDAHGLWAFIVERLKVQQRDAGVRHDLIDAVFALGGENMIVRLLARVHALQAFITTDDGTNLLAGFKRAANILKKEESSAPAQAGAVADLAPSSTTLRPAPEHADVSSMAAPDTALLAALNAAEPQAAAAVAAERFGDAMAALATLRAPIDAFFEGVMVNDPDADVRAFRLGLLGRFRDAVNSIADFSKIEG
jgi:glycyl-tRNA synthetase beta chain